MFYKSETKLIASNYMVDLEAVFGKPAQFITFSNIGDKDVGLEISITGSDFEDQITIPPKYTFTRSMSISKFCVMHTSTTTINYYVDVSKSN